MLGTKREYLERRRQALWTQRSSWEADWKPMASVLIPHRTVWHRSERGSGNRKNRQVYNNKPLLSVRSLAAWLMAGLSSPAREWFSFTLADEDLAKWKPVRMWLEQAREIVQASLSRSSWYRSLASAVYPDMSVVGTSAMFQEIIRGQTRFNPLPIGEYSLDVGPSGDVDTCFRDLTMSVRSMVHKFGNKAVSKTVRDAWDRGNYETMVPVRHAVQPAQDLQGMSIGYRGMPWASCWWEAANDNPNAMLSERGYEEFPVLAPRWAVTTAQDAYGRGPGSDVEGDVLMLQHHEKQMMAMIDKIVDPPTWARGNVKRASLIPGAFVNLGDSEQAAIGTWVNIPPGAIEALRGRIAEVEGRIGEGLFDHLWALLHGDDRNQRPTATEVEATRNETALQMGPLLLSVNDELLKPAVEREFSIRDRHGDIPEPPEEIQGMDIEIEFQSVLETLQQSHGLIAQRALIQDVRMIAEVRPDVLDKLDADNIVDELQRVTGARADSILDAKEVKAVRDARAQQEQAQRQGEAMVQASGAIRNLGQTDTTSLAELAKAVGPAAAAQGGALGRILGAA